MILTNALQKELNNRNLKFLQATEVERFIDAADEVSVPSWPEFMMQDSVANTNWYPLNTQFPDFQFALLEGDSQKWIAVGNSIPVNFDRALEDLPDRGWDWALESGVKAEKPANLLCALAIQILPEYRGNGLSTLMIRIMREIGQHHGLNRLIAPVRPNKKSVYPLTPMDVYIEWSEEDKPFDPWLRVHHRLGARTIKVCPEAMHISGSIESWQKWTGLTFLTSGDYIVPGALSPVQMDVENDRGIYVEANVWMIHDPKV